MNNNLTKIVFELPQDNLGNASTESVWAEPLGSDIYLLRNSPFYAYGFSFEDKVLTSKLADELPVITKLIEPSGRSTYRFIKNRSANISNFNLFWQKLEKIGCTFEEGSGGLYSVDVPPSTNIYLAYELLEQGEQAGVWEFEEANCAHSLDN